MRLWIIFLSGAILLWLFSCANEKKNTTSADIVLHQKMNKHRCDWLLNSIHIDIKDDIKNLIKDAVQEGFMPDEEILKSTIVLLSFFVVDTPTPQRPKAYDCKCFFSFSVQSQEHLTFAALSAFLFGILETKGLNLENVYKRLKNVKEKFVFIQALKALTGDRKDWSALWPDYISLLNPEYFDLFIKIIENPHEEGFIRANLLRCLLFIPYPAGKYKLNYELIEKLLFTVIDNFIAAEQEQGLPDLIGACLSWLDNIHRDKPLADDIKKKILAIAKRGIEHKCKHEHAREPSQKILNLINQREKE